MITLCIVAGDDASLVSKRLSATAPWVEEIVLIDTTLDRRNYVAARALRAHYQAQPLTDFAIVRELALREATQPWILVLDPDEEISSEHLAALRKLATSNSAAAFRIPRYDYIGTTGWGLSRPCRLFRRVDGIRYTGLVYEEPVFPIGTTHEELTTSWGIALHHDGFLQSDVELLAKRRRYRSLIQRATEDHNRSWALEAQSKLLADAGDWNTAMAFCREAQRTAMGKESLRLCLLHARLLIAVGQPELALGVIVERGHFAEWPRYEQSRVENVRALALLALRRYADAHDVLEEALRVGLPVAAYWVNLAVAWRGLGNCEAAKAALTRAILINPYIGQTLSGGFAYQDGWTHRLDTARDCGAVLGTDFGGAMVKS